MSDAEEIAELHELVKGQGAAARPLHPNYLRGRQRKWVNWSLVAEWCRAHPEKPIELDPVHANSIYRFRKNNPDLLVTGSHFRFEEGTHRRVGTLNAVYKPDYIGDEDWALA